MCSFVISQQIVSIATKFHVRSLSIGCCVAATKMGSLVVQDTPLLEKCHHTFHETNPINVLYHGSGDRSDRSGLYQTSNPPGRLFHDPIHGKKDFVTVNQFREMHFHIW